MGALFDLHVKAEFVDRDLDETMSTMVVEPCVNHVPTMMGGHTREAVRASYSAHFIGKWPADTSIAGLAHHRPGARGRRVPGAFTHATAVGAFLPGVAPTGHKVAFERICWDQATVLVQLGLLGPARLPVIGAQQAGKIMDPSLPSNGLQNAA